MQSFTVMILGAPSRGDFPQTVFRHKCPYNDMRSPTESRRLVALAAAMLASGFGDRAFESAALFSCALVGGTSIDVINGYYGAISSNSIDMQGSPGPGSLSQSFATVIGQTYLLSFDLSQNSNASPYLYVSVDGGASTSFLSTAIVTNHTMNYTATAASTLLSFASSNTGAWGGPVLDNISISTAVPEPESYAMMAAGLKLIRFVARRRKQKAA